MSCQGLTLDPISVARATEHMDWLGLGHISTLGSERLGLIPSELHGLRMEEKISKKY